MWTVESLLTTTVKRFGGHICDLVETRAPRPVGEGYQKLRRSKCLSFLLTGITMAKRKSVTRRKSKPRKSWKSSERSGFFPVVTSNLLNMICVATVFATVLVFLLGVAKWT